MEIAASARKHGITADAMRHAADHPLLILSMDNIDMYIGGDQSGRLLKLGVVGDEVIIHAMPARQKFLKLL
ncbi:MAG: toxin [Acidimicrobiales bacterium]